MITRVWTRHLDSCMEISITLSPSSVHLTPRGKDTRNPDQMSLSNRRYPVTDRKFPSYRVLQNAYECTSTNKHTHKRPGTLFKNIFNVLLFRRFRLIRCDTHRTTVPAKNCRDRLSQSIKLEGSASLGLTFLRNVTNEWSSVARPTGAVFFV